MIYNLVDSTRYPSKRYLKLWFRAVLEIQKQIGLETKIISEKNKELDIDDIVEQYYPNPQDYFSGRDLSYNLMLVYKGSEFLNRLQTYGLTVRTLPPYYLEGAYPVRMAPVIGTCEKPTCPICGDTVDPDPYYAKMHRCEGID